MKTINLPPWGPPAAYLYTLNLDAASLAWEYLRRNRAYIGEYALVSDAKGPNIAPKAWGLLRWEDPRVDARSAQLSWIAPVESEIVLSRAQVDNGTARFDLWQIAGWKVLLQDGCIVRLIAYRGSHVLHRVSWPEHLSRDDPLSITLPAGPGFTAGVRAARVLLQSLNGASTGLQSTRPSVQAVTHMHTLQALDGAASGASHRDISRRLFGSNWANADGRWESDSPLRARVRYLIRCGVIRSSCVYHGIGASEASDSSPRIDRERTQ